VAFLRDGGHRKARLHFPRVLRLGNDLFQLNRRDILQWSDLWPDNREQRIAIAFSSSLARHFFTFDRIFRSTLIWRALVECLTKREVKSVNSRIEELDFEGSVYDGIFLPDELIEPGLSNFAGAIRGRVNAAIFAGSGAIQPYDKAYWLGVLRESQHQVQVATVEPEDDLWALTDRSTAINSGRTMA
jgi:hypothetical protein